MLTALTKCDLTSWCAELEQWNATMTMEAFPVGAGPGNSLSHPWGTAAIPGVVQGLMGVTPTAPGYETFTVQPKIGALAHASLKLPTLYGFITVVATPGAVEVGVPCNTAATLCSAASVLKRKMLTKKKSLGRGGSGSGGSGGQLHLHLDGVRVPHVLSGEHVCTAEPVGCGANGQNRVVQAIVE